jgi:predicted dehydrogenase
MKAAVIGCGAIAAQHLPFLGKSPLVELVAVCDSSSAAADFARERFGAAQAFTDVPSMLQHARPEVVHVLTPPHTHVALVKACLDAGAHVICEKPLAPTARETAELLDHAQQRGRMLFESRNYLFNDPVIELRKWQQDGRLGELLEVDLLLSVDFLSGPFGDRNLAGPAVDLPAGAVHDFLPHLAYLFLHFAAHSGDVGKTVGTLQNRSGNPRAGYDFLDSLIFAGNVRGRLRITADVRPDGFRVHLRGDRGSIETDLFNPYFRFEGPPNVGKRASLGQMRNGLTLFRAGFSNLANKVMQHGTYHGIPPMLEAMYLAFSGAGPAPFGRDEMIYGARLVDRLVELREPAG